MLHRTLIILFCFAQPVSAQDYKQYHTWVNNAERCFFLDGKADSAFAYYDSAFSKFDFVFTKDCFMAAQIACHQKNDKYFAYLRKGFANGLRPWHLKLAPVFAQLIWDSSTIMNKFKDYPKLRKQYLSRIKTPVLRHVIEIAAKDQTEKHYPPSQYLPILTKNINYVEALINSVGFPGDKTIGISQINIMKELGYQKQDITDYAWGAATFSDADSNLSQDYIVPLLLHRHCIYILFKPYWNMLISSGQIHPGDVAFIHDWMLLKWGETAQYHKAKLEDFHCPMDRGIDGCYRFNLRIDMTHNSCDRRVTDSLRQKLYMNTIAVDSAKIAVGIKYGFKTNFGCFSNR